MTVNAHGYANGTIIRITSVVGMTELNSKLYTITVTGENTFTLDGVNSSEYTDYVSGGTVTDGTFYAAKQATRMKDFTPGNTLVTDHWGATGVAAMMEPFSPAFQTAGGGVINQRFGSENQVLSEATSGDGWLLTGLGIPNDVNGIDTTGTDLFLARIITLNLSAMIYVSPPARTGTPVRMRGLGCRLVRLSDVHGLLCGVSVWCLLSLMLCSCVSCRSDRMNYYRRKQNAH